MGKPRMIIIIRHAQSEGNKNRSIHQTVPDHRVRLTQEGQTQALEAGKRLRSLLNPEDTIRFYTSPYRRTRETTQGILESLTSDDPEPSPFPRHKIAVFEEPRLREQDFGNFQPCSAAMERMWQERADYGHFFYRIPDGESAADAYDRVSGFHETLFRSFQQDDYPSVTVLVTHGLMSRVFLMKCVEYFEDLRNINHCEFILMKQNHSTGKYILENQLRTWSELRKQKALEQEQEKKKESGTHDVEQGRTKSPAKSLEAPKTRIWGGCPEGCNHDHDDYPKRPRPSNTRDFSSFNVGPDIGSPKSKKRDEQPAVPVTAILIPASPTSVQMFEEESEAFPRPGQREEGKRSTLAVHRLMLAEGGRDFGGSESGAPSPDEDSNTADYGFQSARGSGKSVKQAQKERWVIESGMGSLAMADALGDQDDERATSGESTSLEKQEVEDKSLRGSVY